MGQKLFVPIAVVVLVAVAGVALYFIMGDSSPRPEPPKQAEDEEQTTEEPGPAEINPADFDPARIQPDPVKNDRPEKTYTPAETNEHFIVSGRVIDEAGLGVGDAHITFIGEKALRDYTGRGYTDPTGFYRLVAWAPNPAGTMHSDAFARIVAETPAGGRGALPSMKVETDGEILMPDIEVHAGGTIEGQVLTEDGRAVPGAEVTVRSSGVVEIVTMRGRKPGVARRQLVKTVFADAHGNYRVENLPRAEYRAHAQGGYFGHNTRNTPLDMSSGGTLWYEIRLPDTPRIRGMVLDQYGDPVSGAVVQLVRTPSETEDNDKGDTDPGTAGAVSAVRRDDAIRRVDDTPRRFENVVRLSGRREVTDAHGRFGFHAGPGDNWALVTRIGEAEARVEDVKPADSDYTLSVTVETSVGGIVRDTETGRVIEEFDVRVRKGDPTEVSPFERVSPDGRFQLRPGGRYSVANPPGDDVVVRVSAPGYAPASVKVTNLREGDQRRDVDVSLKPLCDLTIELIHEGRRLDLVPVAMLFDDRLAYTAGTDELGRARIPAVTPTAYRVKVVMPDGGVLEGTADVPPTADAHIEVELKPAS